MLTTYHSEMACLTRRVRIWVACLGRWPPVRMTALVDDLLLLARLDQGRPLARETVDLQLLVQDALQNLMRGRTTILITHRLELARRAERVVVLEGGRIVEEGTAESLLGRGAAFAGLFGGGPLQPVR